MCIPRQAQLDRMRKLHSQPVHHRHFVYGMEPCQMWHACSIVIHHSTPSLIFECKLACEMHSRQGHGACFIGVYWLRLQHPLVDHHDKQHRSVVYKRLHRRLKLATHVLIVLATYIQKCLCSKQNEAPARVIWCTNITVSITSRVKLPHRINF